LYNTKSSDYHVIRFLAKLNPEALTIRHGDNGYLPLDCALSKQVSADHIRPLLECYPSDILQLSFDPDEQDDDDLEDISTARQQRQSQFASILASSKTKVRVLDCRDCYFQTEEKKSILETMAAELTIIEEVSILLDEEDVGDGQDSCCARVLEDMLRKNKVLRSLKIQFGMLGSQRKIPDESTRVAAKRLGRALARGLRHNHNLETLELDTVAAPLCQQDMTEILQGCSQCIRCLSLSNMPGLGNSLINGLSNRANNCTLASFSLKGDSDMSSRQVKKLISVLSGTCDGQSLSASAAGSLEELYLSGDHWNADTLEGIQRFSKLRILSLASAEMDPGLLDSSLLTVLQGSKLLSELRLHGIRWDDASLAKMSNALRGPQVALEHLDIGFVQNGVSLQPIIDTLREGGSCNLLRIDLQSVDCSSTRQGEERELAYQCELNGAGRGATRKSITTKCQFVRLLNNNGTCENLSLAYGMLREVPHLWAG